MPQNIDIQNLNLEKGIVNINDLNKVTIEDLYTIEILIKNWNRTVND